MFPSRGIRYILVEVEEKAWQRLTREWQKWSSREYRKLKRSAEEKVGRVDGGPGHDTIGGNNRFLFHVLKGGRSRETKLRCFLNYDSWAEHGWNWNAGHSFAIVFRFPGRGVAPDDNFVAGFVIAKFPLSNLHNFTRERNPDICMNFGAF